MQGGIKMNEYKRTLEWISSRYDLPNELNDATIESFVSEPGSLPSIWGLCGKDVSAFNFNDVSEVAFLKLTFNEYTNFPDNMDIDYKRIFEE